MNNNLCNVMLYIDMSNRIKKITNRFLRTLTIIQDLLRNHKYCNDKKLNNSCTDTQREVLPKNSKNHKFGSLNYSTLKVGCDITPSQSCLVVDFGNKYRTLININV